MPGRDEVSVVRDNSDFCRFPSMAPTDTTVLFSSLEEETPDLTSSNQADVSAPGGVKGKNGRVVCFSISKDVDKHKTDNGNSCDRCPVVTGAQLPFLLFGP